MSAADLSCINRFLSAADQDVDRAYEMLMEMVEWRCNNGVEDIWSSYVCHQRAALLSAYPQGYHKTDRMVGSSSSSDSAAEMHSITGVKDVHQDSLRVVVGTTVGSVLAGVPVRVCTISTGQSSAM